jgi:hypothetical protein
LTLGRRPHVKQVVRRGIWVPTGSRTRKGTENLEAVGRPRDLTDSRHFCTTYTKLMFVPKPFNAVYGIKFRLIRDSFESHKCAVWVEPQPQPSTTSAHLSWPFRLYCGKQLQNHCVDFREISCRKMLQGIVSALQLTVTSTCSTTILHEDLRALSCVTKREAVTGRGRP